MSTSNITFFPAGWTIGSTDGTTMVSNGTSVPLASEFLTYDTTTPMATSTWTSSSWTTWTGAPMLTRQEKRLLTEAICDAIVKIHTA